MSVVRFGRQGWTIDGRQLVAAGKRRRTESHKRSTGTRGGYAAMAETWSSSFRSGILRTPVDMGGPIPNLAGGPAGPATRETLTVADLHNHA